MKSMLKNCDHVCMILGFLLVVLLGVLTFITIISWSEDRMATKDSTHISISVGVDIDNPKHKGMHRYTTRRSGSESHGYLVHHKDRFWTEEHVDCDTDRQNKRIKTLNNRKLSVKHGCW